jgi:hypothetical protein
LPPKRTLPLYGLGLDVAEALHKSNGPLAIEQPRVGAKYPMVGNRRLLRAPRDTDRTACERDELAPFQMIELHSVPASQGRFAGYRMGRDQSAGIGALAKPVPAPLGGIAREMKSIGALLYIPRGGIARRSLQAVIIELRWSA